MQDIEIVLRLPHLASYADAAVSAVSRTYFCELYKRRYAQAAP